MDWLLRKGDACWVIRTRHDGDGDGRTKVHEKRIEGICRGGGICRGVVAVFLSIVGFSWDSLIDYFWFCEGVAGENES